MTVTLPNIENAMIPDITRGARCPPNTEAKKTVAMSSLQLFSINVGFASTSVMRVWLNLSTESLTERQRILKLGS